MNTYGWMGVGSVLTLTHLLTIALGTNLDEEAMWQFFTFVLAILLLLWVGIGIAVGVGA